MDIKTRTAFIQKLRALEPHKTPFEKFRDLCELAFCAYAKPTAPTAERAQTLEDRYMQIVRTYRDKDTVRAYPELLAMALVAISAGGCDFLGQVATELEILHAQNGQFFTPYEVARAMATMTLVDVKPTIEEHGFITICEPASGAGGMVLACADTLADQGFDPSLHMLVQATDIASLCYHMTFLQLTMRGIAANVEHGNSLSLETFDHAWTPPTVAFYAHHGKLFPPGHAKAAEPAPPRTSPKQLSLL
jgi:hypothetical protein